MSTTHSETATENLDHGGTRLRVVMEAVGPDIDGFVSAAFYCHAGEGDQLGIHLDGPTMLRGLDAHEQANPWTACIWPGHEDGKKHCCDNEHDLYVPHAERGWCLRRYPTVEAALDALCDEFNRRHPDTSTPVVLVLP